jgi:hypothetical protein
MRRPSKDFDIWGQWTAWPSQETLAHGVTEVYKLGCNIDH